MKTLSAQQAALAAGATLKRVKLVKLTTYSDRGLGTVDTVYYFSDYPVLYKYGGGSAVQFEVFLTTVGDESVAMNHLPLPNAGEAAISAGSGLKVGLANLPYRGGNALLRVLRGHNIEFARIEVAAVLVPPARLAVDPTPPLIDLTDYAGTEHLIVFRGEVKQVSDVTESEFALACAMEDIQLPWIYATDPSIVDPKDLGARLPVVYGSMKHVPCIGLQVGWVTTLADPIVSATATGLFTVTDISGLPGAGSFSVRIGSEEVAASVSSGQLNITARGQNGTQAQLHPAGDIVVELITTAIFGVAGHAVKAINTVYAISPYTGKLIALTSAFTKTLSDASTISGKTIASLSFTTAQLRTAMAAMASEAKVTQQPTGATATQHDQPLTVTVSGTDNPQLRDGVVGNTGPGSIGATGVIATFQAPSTPPSSQVIRAYLLATSGTIQFRVSSSGGTLFGTITPAADGWYSFATTDTGNVFWIGPSSGGLFIREVERLIDSSYTQVQQSATSAFDDTLRDGDEVTGLAINNTGGTVTFPSYSGTFKSQTIRVVRTTTAGDGDVRVGGVLIGNIFAGDPTGVYLFKTTQSSNTITVNHTSGGLGTVINLSEVSRTVNVDGAGNVAIAAAQVGFGLRLFADTDGVFAPNGTDYSVGINVLLEKPADIIKHFIAVFAGLGTAAIDSASFSAALTNLGSDKLAAWLNPFGVDFWSLLSLLAFNARANITSEEGASVTTYKLLTAQSTYDFPAGAITIDTWTGCGEQGRDATQLVNRLRFSYGFDPAVSGSDQAAFSGILQANKDVNDLSSKVATSVFTAAEQRYGPRVDTPRLFHAIADQATAIEVAAYYAKELMRIAGTYTVTGVPWWLGYVLERGDIVSFTPPWDTAKKCRVVRFARAFTEEKINLTLVEVP